MASLEQQLRAIEKKLQGKMRRAMQSVAPVIKEVQSEQVEKKVYDAYPNPKQYDRRRDDGGLSSVDNMIHDITDVNGGIMLRIVNMTMSNPDFLPDNGKSPFYIAGVVSQGHGYGNNYYDYPYDSRFTNPRDFIQATRDELARSGKHILAFKEGLRKQGVKVE